MTVMMICLAILAVSSCVVILQETKPDRPRRDEEKGA